MVQIFENQNTQDVLPFKGKITTVMYYEPETGFAIFKIRQEEETKSSTAKGYVPNPVAGAKIYYNGTWKEDQKFGGYYIAISNSKIDYAGGGKDAIIELLSSDFVPGVGPTVAKKIVDHFGKDALRVIEREPERLKEISGIGVKSADRIHEGYMHIANDQELIALLLPYLSIQKINSVIKKFGTGLENILVLEKNGQPAAMLAAVPVKYGQHRGVWLCGAAGVQGVPMDRLLPKIMEGCLRAYGASGFDFAVTTPDDARRAEDLKTLGFKSQLPLRVIQTPIRRDLFAQAAFDSLTVHKLLERRHIYQPGCISLPEEAMNETMTQLYRRGLTVVSTRRGYGLYFTKGDTLQFLELQADNDHCADQLLQAAREKTGAANARILLAENQTLYLGSGRRCGYGMIAFLGRPFSVTDAYFRMLL